MNRQTRTARILPTASASGVHARGSMRGFAAKHERFQKNMQGWITILFTLLILEGLLRKAFHFLSLPLFFAKDFLVLFLGIKAFMGGLPQASQKIFTWQIISVILVIPCFLNTLLLDPVLGTFGLKQYCLFPFAGVALCAAYLPDKKAELLKLLQYLTATLFVTTAVAVAQNQLPPSHWLNVNPDGQSLEAFSAGGKIRVTSTFSFVAQYCIYLNGILGVMAAYFFLRPGGKKRVTRLIFPLLIGACYLVAIFITGSRSSAIGAMVMTAGSMLLLMLSSGSSNALRIALMGAAFGVAYFIIHAVFPDAFVAYEARSQNTVYESHAQQIINRVSGDLLGWTDKLKHSPFLGNGIGLESNGSEKLSSYAAMMKNRWGWMESDSQTVLFEGGVYLMTIWYGFRFAIILYMAFCVISIRDVQLATAASFCWGFIALGGLIGTLSIQPPLAIWWWFTVGLILCFREYDRRNVFPAEKSDAETALSRNSRLARFAKVLRQNTQRPS